MLTAERRWVTYLVWVAAVLLIGASLVPLIVSNRWWIRVFTFPQAQITVLLFIVTVAALAFLNLQHSSSKLLIAGLAGAIVYQLQYLLPYSPLFPKQVQTAERCAPERQVRVLVFNVLKSNRSQEEVVALVRDRAPDLFLGMETDFRWVRALEPLRSSYPAVVSAPRDSAWGMMLFSRLPLVSPEVRHLVDGYVPSIRAGVRLRSGSLFVFHGLHPKPPVMHSSAAGDAELIRAGREVRKTPRAAMLAGDLNDVPWSKTTELFQEVSGMGDPRVGRQFLASFDAHNPLLRWPLDHIFVTPSFRLMELERLPAAGSDHFPILADFCYVEAIDTPAERETLESGTRQRVQEVIAEGRPAQKP